MIRADRSVMQTRLPAGEPPDDEELYGLAPDPDAGPLDGPDAWLSGLPTRFWRSSFRTTNRRWPGCGSSPRASCPASASAAVPAPVSVLVRCWTPWMAARFWPA